MLLILFLVSHMAFAAEAVSSISTDLDHFFPVPTSHASNNVQKELECVQLQLGDKLALIKTQQATDMIRVMSIPLEDGFKKFGFNMFERALFYSQVIEESAGFTQLSESAKFSKGAGADPIGQVLTTFNNDSQFHKKVHKERSRQFGAFRGRGLIQITGCDNYLSVIHYLNLLYSDQKPAWKTYWEIGREKDRDNKNKSVKKISAICSAQELKTFEQQYRTAYGMDANLYGALDDPMRFAMIGAELKDPISGKTISSEQFMVDASMAYWRGRCGDVVDYLSTNKPVRGYVKCQDIRGGDYLSQTAKCLTKCIKGTTDGWEQRAKWLRTTLLCAR